jgi:hypothetical protein
MKIRTEAPQFPYEPKPLAGFLIPRVPDRLTLANERALTGRRDPDIAH